MNRPLVGFSVLLIGLGVVFGVVPAVLFGIFLLIPALFARQSRKTYPVSSSTQPQPRRVAPPTPYQPLQARTQERVPETSRVPVFQLPPAPVYLNYSPALFPSSFFPSTSQLAPSPPKPAEQKAPQSKDELLEIGAILALLKVAFG